MSALFPDVPVFPGVPPVLRQFFPQPVDALQADSPQVQDGERPFWGILDGNDLPVLETADSFAAVEFRLERRISDYPIEGGQFESYNKVALPYGVRVMLTKGGTDNDRSGFMREVDARVLDTSLYTVVTPEVAYGPVNLIGYDYRRSSENGASLLVVEIQAQQVRTEATLTFSNSKEPAGAGVTNDGPVQTRDAPADTGSPR